MDVDALFRPQPRPTEVSTTGIDKRLPDFSHLLRHLRTTTCSFPSGIPPFTITIWPPSQTSRAVVQAASITAAEIYSVAA